MDEHAAKPLAFQLHATQLYESIAWFCSAKPHGCRYFTSIKDASKSNASAEQLAVQCPEDDSTSSTTRATAKAAAFHAEPLELDYATTAAIDGYYSIETKLNRSDSTYKPSSVPDVAFAELYSSSKCSSAAAISSKPPATEKSVTKSASAAAAATTTHDESFSTTKSNATPVV